MSKFAHDAALIKTKALPAAAATAYSDSLDLVGTNPGVQLADVEIEFGAEAVPDLVDAKTNIMSLQDSADDSSFTDIAGLATLTQTGASSAGAAAASRSVRLPSNVRRYVRAKSVVLTAGGDNTAKEFFIKAKF